MALALLNRAKMTVSGTPGTGTITLNAAATDFQTFATAGIHDGARVPYLIEDGSNWEYGLGDYTASGTTLARTDILGSSNSGSAISATSSATVAIVPLGQVFPTHAGIKPIPPIDAAYNVSDVLITTPAAGGSTTNGLFFSPFTVGARRFFNRIGVRTGSFSSTMSIRVGIYRDSINGGVPGRLLLDAGVITTSTSNTTLELTISLTMEPGLYWLASTANAAGSFQNLTSGSCYPIALNSSYAHRHSLYTSHTYGALPSDVTSATFSLETLGTPAIHLRRV